jgi:hypothetical protein
MRPAGYEPDNNIPIMEANSAVLVWDHEGHIITNNRVVENADEITLTTHDGISKWQGRRLSANYLASLAVTRSVHTVHRVIARLQLDLSGMLVNHLEWVPAIAAISKPSLSTNSEKRRVQQPAPDRLLVVTPTPNAMHGRKSPSDPTAKIALSI